MASEISGAAAWLPKPKKAEQQGVCTKTIDRWVEQGRLPKPKIVNGRVYHRVDAEPRYDDAQ
jgi:hypothetical protein